MTYSNEPIEIDGKIFQPLLHLLYVEEPDFGCEGVPEDGAVCGSIVAEDAAGRRTIPIGQRHVDRYDGWCSDAAGRKKTSVAAQ